jgi:glutathione S-transferase
MDGHNSVKVTNMTEIVLYMFPGACSRVTMSALEEACASYETRAVNLRSAEQQSADYRAINREGKVPALSYGGQLMTENAAILAFLAATYPAAHLLPTPVSGMHPYQGLIDLVWCASTLHPIVRQIRAPQKYTNAEPAGIEADGLQKLHSEAAFLSERLTGTNWWYGQVWSILDVYLYWAYSTAAKGSFPLSAYPNLIAHAERVRIRPSFQRALARELQTIERERFPLDPLSL